MPQTDFPAGAGYASPSEDQASRINSPSARFPRPEANNLNNQPSLFSLNCVDIQPISLAKASSNHHSSGGFGIEVSPEP
jgi:hypothetical protein